jgi:hypothetical protein
MALHDQVEQMSVRISSDVAEWVRLQSTKERGGKKLLVEEALRALWSAREAAGDAIILQAPECVRIGGHDAHLLKCPDCENATWG